MTILGRFLLRSLERALGIYHEGPHAPSRIAASVRAWSAAHPAADREQWERWAVTIAERSYEQGFARGQEYCERSWGGPAVDPEQLLEQQNASAVPSVAELLGPANDQEWQDYRQAVDAHMARGGNVRWFVSPLARARGNRRP